MIAWTEITDDELPDGIVLVANRWGLLGVVTGRSQDVNGDDWFLDGHYFDGDEPPVWWIQLPPIPTEKP